MEEGFKDVKFYDEYLRSSKVRRDKVHKEDSAERG